MGKSRREPSTEPPTATEIEKAALHYVERYSSSVAGLRRVMRRRIRRAVRQGRGEVAEGDALVEGAIAKLVRLGLLDDARFAMARAASLVRRGGSIYMIRRDLVRRGVAAPLIDAALAELKDEAGGNSDSIDHAAARALARRRRLGPFRAATARAAFRMKDLAALGRAGFAYEIARAVIDGEADNG